MLRFILSPQWFLTPDIAIDLFSFLVLLTFAIISLKYYCLSKNKKFMFLGLAFFLVGLGELFKIIMNFGLYYDFPVTYQVGRMIVTSHVVRSVDIVYYIGFFLHRFFVMLGFYLLYYTTKRSRSKWEHLLILYFIVISAIFSDNAHYIFNITMALLLTVVFVNYQSVYKETKSKNTKILMSGFFILIVSYLMMIFSKLSNNIYIFANLLQLIAYIIFLCVIIRIYKHIENRRLQNSKNFDSGRKLKFSMFSNIQTSRKFKYGKKK